jgi:hypothetical protein
VEICETDAKKRRGDIHHEACRAAGENSGVDRNVSLQDTGEGPLFLRFWGAKMLLER